VTTALDLPDTWAYGAGVLHGGWLLETITAAALQETSHPHPLAVSAHYAAAPGVGPAELDVEVLREGRSVGSLRAMLSQEGRPKVSVLVTAGRLPEAGASPRHLAAHPPQMPPPEMCLRHEMPDGMPRWLRCVQRARLVHGGWLDEECEVWDASGQLVVQARQLAGYRA
jgi:acyl-CoA thioesterase